MLYNCVMTNCLHLTCIFFSYQRLLLKVDQQTCLAARVVVDTALREVGIVDQVVVLDLAEMATGNPVVLVALVQGSQEGDLRNFLVKQIDTVVEDLAVQVVLVALESSAQVNLGDMVTEIEARPWEIQGCDLAAFGDKPNNNS